MDRLLTDEEIKNAVYDKPKQGAARWTKTVIPRDSKIAKAQDAKTARLVAKDILDELEEKCNCYPDFDFEDIKGACPRCRRNIRSKWGIEQSRLYSIYAPKRPEQEGKDE